MNYYELLVKVVITQNDIYFSKANEELSKLMNKSMLEDTYLSELHTRRGYKNYSYSSLYPTEKDKIYKKGKMYKFLIRSADSEFICAMQYCLNKASENSNISVSNISLTKKTQKFITELITITPAIVTNGENNHWKKGEDINILNKKLHDNLKFKYNKFFNKDIQDNNLFFYSLEIKNRKPIFTNYKGGHLIGNKLVLQIKEDEASQKIASMALVCGLGEKNSIGMGFCHAW